MTAAGAKKPFLDLQKTLDGVYPGLLTAVFVVFFSAMFLVKI